MNDVNNEAYPGAPGAAGPQGLNGATGQPAIPGITGSYEDLGWNQNYLAGRLQNLELGASDEVIRQSRTAVRNQSEGLSVAYALPGAVSLPSRDDQQMFRIAVLELKANAYYTVVPLLSDYVYLAADAKNDSEFSLLPGPYNAYVDGSFAGRGTLPLIARGQELSIGFGTETQLRASRELVDKDTEIRGGNQLVTYHYKMRLQNYMNAPVAVRVWDSHAAGPEYRRRQHHRGHHAGEARRSVERRRAVSGRRSPPPACCAGTCSFRRARAARKPWS